MSSEAYRVPTTPVLVKLILWGGDSHELLLFLPTASETRSGPETLDEYLNNDRGFIAARSKDSDRSFLVNRQRIVLVEADASFHVLLRREDGSASVIAKARVQMTTGLVVEGAPLMMAPPGHARVSDFFNQKETFLPIETGNHITYVNKQHVVSVWL